MPMILDFMLTPTGVDVWSKWHKLYFFVSTTDIGILIFDLNEVCDRKDF